MPVKPVAIRLKPCSAPGAQPPTCIVGFYGAPSLTTSWFSSFLWCLCQERPLTPKDAASATVTSFYVGIACHQASVFTERHMYHKFLCHRRFSSLRYDCQEVFHASQDRCTTLDAVQRSTSAASPSHCPGSYRVSILTPILLSSSRRFLHTGHPPTTKVAGYATACLASRQVPTRLIVGLLHKSRLITMLDSMQ